MKFSGGEPSGVSVEPAEVWDMLTEPDGAGFSVLEPHPERSTNTTAIPRDARRVKGTSPKFSVQQFSEYPARAPFPLALTST